MNIQAEKLKIMRLILETDNPSILNSIKRIFSKSKEDDFWNSLSQYQKDEILLGIQEIENGEIVDYEAYMKKHK